mmetsp:Transcript_35816/g.83180  ORF Transcript_35816/g.83180 Transcript_35816/m.83180 type:complete len:214 (+) Transcript_35816:182-823(+)
MLCTHGSPSWVARRQPSTSCSSDSNTSSSKRLLLAGSMTFLTSLWTIQIPSLPSMTLPSPSLERNSFRSLSLRFAPRCRADSCTPGQIRGTCSASTSRQSRPSSAWTRHTQPSTPFRSPSGTISDLERTRCCRSSTLSPRTRRASCTNSCGSLLPDGAVVSFWALRGMTTTATAETTTMGLQRPRLRCLARRRTRSSGTQIPSPQDPRDHTLP